LELYKAFRQLEGFLKALAKFEPKLKVPDYTTIWNRLESLKLDLKPSLNEPIVIALDASGIKVANRGEWIRHKWKVRRGYLKIHLALEVTNESIKEGEMLKPLIEKAKIKRALADGAFDSRENFNYLSQIGIEPCIKVRKNSSTKAKGCMPRKLVAMEYLSDPKAWKLKVGYGKRWMVETALSCIKRLFGEYVMVKEMILKASLYNIFISLNPIA